MHGPGLLVAFGIFLLAALLPYKNGEVILELCTLKHFTGIPCPFCGSTRTFAAAIQGDWGWALQNSPLAFLLFLLSVCFGIWNCGALLFREVWLPGAWFRPPCLTWRKAFWILFLLISANYAYRLLRGLY